ncbi:DNA-binding transcriptional MerR regulator [Stackebrandtia albiflava]|uniref:DNA-binding transcriptional MerR regulator n=1 Tax=Stackebrandtia albiflava TaxID=406432 RepID=A0A562VEA7_9ACTN|nr:MerR family transcriptional regulator [Stackebrandtia albiflava]TWJ16195.1 DNA-binding transcriptional MerR regulator [Stackebrandtia albiflava]
MSETARWSIGELADRVAAALADDYPGPPSGRVRGVPDVRAIRWYATIGLLDKPAAHRGRTALYGERHLRQLVAVKRRQAAGLSLAEIQAELAGVGDARLAEIAGLPAEAATESEDTRPESPPDSRFWARRPTVKLKGHTPDPPEEDTDVSYCVPLGPGASLLLAADAVPDPADVAALRQAAEPLLRVLRERGLHRTGVHR